MPAVDFNEMELKARTEAGRAGGVYLEGLGKFNLRELSKDEYGEFCERVIDGFGCALREMMVAPHG